MSIERSAIVNISRKLQDEGKLPLIEVHTLRPSSCALMNCGQDGRQKTIVFGGITRNRLSSQSIKFAIRAGEVNNEEQRTRYLPEQIINHIRKNLTATGNEDRIDYATNLVLTVFSSNKKRGDFVISNQVLHMTDAEIFAHVDVICEQARTTTEKRPSDKTKKQIGGLILAVTNTLRLTEDIALNGRMATTQGIRTIYAASHYGHAYSINAAHGDYDDFVANDDYILRNGITVDEDESTGDGNATGTAFLHTRDIGSDVFYHYSGVATNILFENLMIGHENTEDEISEVLQQTYEVTERFVDAVLFTYPVAHQTTMASTPLPVAACICRSTRQNTLTFDRAFETPVYGNSTASVARQGTRRMAREADLAMHGAFAKPRYDGVYWLSDPDYDDAQLPDDIHRATVGDISQIIGHDFD